MAQMYVWHLKVVGEVEYDHFRAMAVVAATEDQALYKVARSKYWSHDSKAPFQEQIENVLQVGLPTSVEEYLQYEMCGFDESDDMIRRTHWTIENLGATHIPRPCIIVADFLHG